MSNFAATQDRKRRYHNSNATTRGRVSQVQVPACHDAHPMLEGVRVREKVLHGCARFKSASRVLVSLERATGTLTLMQPPIRIPQKVLGGTGAKAHPEALAVGLACAARTCATGTGLGLTPCTRPYSTPDHHACTVALVATQWFHEMHPPSPPSTAQHARRGAHTRPGPRVLRVPARPTPHSSRK